MGENKMVRLELVAACMPGKEKRSAGLLLNMTSISLLDND
jgi:hypothetical protein